MSLPSPPPTWDVDLDDEGCGGCPFPVEIHPEMDLSRHVQICGLAVCLPVEEHVSVARALPTPAANDGPTPAPAWCPLRGPAGVLVRAE